MHCINSIEPTKSLSFNVMTNDDYHYDIVKIDKNERISRNFPYYYRKHLTVTLSIDEKCSKAGKNNIFGD